ncbi:MAG TPA: NAD-dependent epimerase/dehydratase family protein [Prolixibacteraceae bacterium]|nr:NAD-dependent epimerase/dehydratase family protein [Prolixibacteraceae bacterium]
MNEHRYMNMEKATVLVSGANGFLAANVVRELLSRGYRVRGMIRENARLTSLEHIKIEYFSGQITKREDVDRAVEGCSVVIHVAADTSQRYDTAAPLMQVNVTATRYFIEACKKHAVGRFIFVSTGNTIDFGSLENPGHEGNPLGKLFRKSGYALSKLMAEEQVVEAVKNDKLSAVIVNPTFMIGPYDSKPSSGRILQMMVPHSLVFIPKGGKNFVDVKAVATAICNAIDRGTPGERYLLAGINLSYREFLALVRKGKKTLAVVLPGWLLLSMGAIGSLFRKLGIASELSVNNARILCSDDFYTNRKARSELDMPESNIEQAVSEAIEWMKEHGMLGK